MNEKLAVILDHLIENWKSTVANLLTISLIGIGYLLTLPKEQLLANGLSSKELFWLGALNGVLKIYVALITKDAK